MFERIAMENHLRLRTQARTPMRRRGRLPAPPYPRPSGRPHCPEGPQRLIACHCTGRRGTCIAGPFFAAPGSRRARQLHQNVQRCCLSIAWSMTHAPMPAPSCAWLTRPTQLPHAQQVLATRKALLCKYIAGYSSRAAPHRERQRATDATVVASVVAACAMQWMTYRIDRLWPAIFPLAKLLAVVQYILESL